MTNRYENNIINYIKYPETASKLVNLGWIISPID